MDTKLTKREREIVQLALQNLIKRDDSLGICFEFHELFIKDLISVKEYVTLKHKFIYLFKPSYKATYFWPIHEKETRIIALQLFLEATK